mmetsp:Transcript_3774/g.4615  ORF Transcript_3774/g.4615 Transcript_3774/m.4615 type:complete len:101 (+) Transcript_3774:292-594(+)
MHKVMFHIPEKLALKPSKTVIGQERIDYFSLFSSNVVSERIRKDPREKEDLEITYETIHELELDIEENEFDSILKTDEDIPMVKHIDYYKDKLYIASNIA